MIMSMADMDMTFFVGTMVDLFSDAWMPMGDGEYAGTCIFLIVFTAIFRGLLAIRGQFYPLLSAFDSHRHGGKFVPVPVNSKGIPRWRARDAVLLATLDMIVAGVGYLVYVPNST